MRCGFSSSCFSTLSFEPDESVTYSRPCSSKSAAIGRFTSGGPATSLISNPGGRVKALSGRLARGVATASGSAAAAIATPTPVES